MRGASVAPVALTETDLELLEKRVNRSWPKNPAKFAWVVGRNFAIDKRRSLDRAARREQEAMLAAEEDRIKREKREAAVKEFAGLIVDLVPTLGLTQRRWIGMVRLSAVEGATDADCAERFPASPRQQRYQWKSRGIKLIRQLASPELRRFFGCR